MKGSRWWLWSSGFIALMMVALGVGNLIEDDGGPLYGQILFAAVLIGGAIAIGVGIRMRAGQPQRGSRLVAIGVLPGASGIAFFWFPPAVAVGALALASSIAAFRDADGLRSPARTSLLAVLATTVAVTIFAVGVS